MSCLVSCTMVLTLPTSFYKISTHAAKSRRAHKNTIASCLPVWALHESSESDCSVDLLPVNLQNRKSRDRRKKTMEIGFTADTVILDIATRDELYWTQSNHTLPNHQIESNQIINQIKSNHVVNQIKPSPIKSSGNINQIKSLIWFDWIFQSHQLIWFAPNPRNEFHWNLGTFLQIKRAHARKRIYRCFISFDFSLPESIRWIVETALLSHGFVLKPQQRPHHLSSAQPLQLCHLVSVREGGRFVALARNHDDFPAGQPRRRGGRTSSHNGIEGGGDCKP